MIPVYPGADVAISEIPAKPTVWWLRPVSSAARVGEHKAVVWNRLYFNPPHDSLSRVGVLIGPPNADDAPKPTSSIRTINTFGALAGGRNGSIGGNFADGSLALNGRTPRYWRSGIGRTSRFILLFRLFLESSVPFGKIPVRDFIFFIFSVHMPVSCSQSRRG